MEIKVYATLRDVVGGKSIQLDNPGKITTRQMLDVLFNRYPALQTKLLNRKGELHTAFHILLNGRDVRYMEGLETVIQSSDEVRIFPPVGGGHA